MVSDHEWLSFTRIAGLTAYTASFLACALRWASCRKQRVADWPLAAAAQLYLLMDMALDWRWKLHDFSMREATAIGVYQWRRLPQILAVGLVALGLVFASVRIWRKLKGAIGRGLALTGTLFSIGLWCSECVSLHFMDAILYRMAGKVMIVSLLWVAGAAITCFGAWLDGRQWRAS